MLIACLASVCTAWLIVTLLTGVRGVGASLFLEEEQTGLPEGPLELSPAGRVALLLSLFGLVAAAAVAMDTTPETVEATRGPVAVERP